VTRPRTNTPSAALALMNDVQFVEAARNLAQRVLREAGPSTDDRIRHAFRLATCRFPTDSEAAVLRRLYLDSRQAYRDNVDLAVKLLGVGESPRDQDEEAAELAAWTMVANTILNLDETISQG
jgi:hypothetical protein